MPAPRIFCDVTGLLRWGAQLPTGIQRIEHALARFAWDAPDIGLVAFDARRRRFAPLTSRETAYLGHILGSASAPTGQSGIRRAARSLTYLGVQIAHNNVETGRRIGAAISGDPTGTSWRFLAAKTTARSLLWIAEGGRSCAIGVASLVARATKRRPNWSGGGALCLVAHATSVRSECPAAAQAAGLKPVFIVHDLIPVLDPSYEGTRFAARFAEFLSCAARSRQPVITLSAAVAADLTAWAGSLPGAVYPPRIEICPCPNSIAAPDAFIEPYESPGGRPFVLFCSTINPRKNQHLLVAAWARLSEQLGDALPDLVMIGRPAKRYAALETALASAAAISHRIHFQHGVSDAQLRGA